MKKILIAIFALAMLFAIATVGNGQISARKRHHGVATRTKNGAKYVAHKTKRGTKWTYHKGAKGTRWTAHKTKRGTKHIYHKTKRALQ